MGTRRYPRARRRRLASAAGLRVDRATRAWFAPARSYAAPRFPRRPGGARPRGRPRTAGPASPAGTSSPAPSSNSSSQAAAGSANRQTLELAQHRQQAGFALALLVLAELVPAEQEAQELRRRHRLHRGAQGFAGVAVDACQQPSITPLLRVRRRGGAPRITAPSASSAYSPSSDFIARCSSAPGARPAHSLSPAPAVPAARAGFRAGRLRVRTVQWKRG